MMLSLWGNTFLDHLNNLQHVFHRIRAAGLKLQPNRCALCQKEVSFLGYIISQAGIATDLRKTERVISWLLPTSKCEVQQFLGLANYYRRFIKNFAKIAKPLYKLIEKSAPFLWTAECKLAFDNLKHSLTSAPVLAHLDYNKPFILDTDANQTGIGAVLSQVQGDGCERVIAYASKVGKNPIIVLLAVNSLQLLHLCTFFALIFWEGRFYSERTMVL